MSLTVSGNDHGCGGDLLQQGVIETVTSSMVGKDEDLGIEIFSCFKKPGQPIFLKVAKAENSFLSDFDEERERHLVGMLGQGQVFSLIRIDNAQNDIFLTGQPQ